MPEENPYEVLARSIPKSVENPYEAIGRSVPKPKAEKSFFERSHERAKADWEAKAKAGRQQREVAAKVVRAAELAVPGSAPAPQSSYEANSAQGLALGKKLGYRSPKVKNVSEAQRISDTAEHFRKAGERRLAPVADWLAPAMPGLVPGVAISRAVRGDQDDELYRQALRSVLGFAANLPVEATASGTMLISPQTGVRDKAGAALELASYALPLEEMVIGSGVKAIRNLSATRKAFGKLAEEGIDAGARAYGREAGEKVVTGVTSQKPRVNVKAPVHAPPYVVDPNAKANKVGAAGNKAASPPPVPSGAIRVTVDEKQFDLSGPARSAYEEAESEFKRRVASAKAAGGYEEAGKIKAAGLMFSKRKREITGTLTGKEQKSASAQAAKVTPGKKVTVDGQEAEVLGYPTFGKVKVRLQDGSEMSVEMSRIGNRAEASLGPMEGVSPMKLTDAAPVSTATPAKLTGATAPAGDFGMATRFEPAGSARPKSGVTVDVLAEQGRKAVDEGRVTPESVYAKVARDEDLTPEELSAAAYRGKQIENRVGELSRQMDDPNLDPISRTNAAKEMARLEEEMGQILDAGTIGQRSFHQIGQALQVAFTPTYKKAELSAKMKRIWGADDIPEAIRKQIEDAGSQIEKLRDDLAAARKEVADLVSGSRSRKPTTPAQRTKLVDGIMSDLGLGRRNIAGLPEAPPVGGGRRSKKSGALNVPGSVADRLHKKATALARSYIEEGADSLDSILARFKADLPMLGEDDVLGLLSGKYRQVKLDADVQKLAVDKALRRLREQAEFRQKTLLRRASSYAADALLSLNRQLQTGIDMSAATIQGLPTLIVSPSSWLRAWEPAVRALLNWERGKAPTLGKLWKGNDASLQATALIHSDPAVRYAKKAQLSFTDVDGPLTMQEEQFVGRIPEWFRESKIPVAREYAELLGRSNEAYAGFLNKIRLDLFKKFTNGTYNDPDHLRDMARLTNIITGRGDGQMAQALANKNFGYIFYAPRYMLSQFQNAALPLLLPTFKTTRGKLTAMSVWGKQAAALYTSLKVAEMFGLKVEWDPRSSDWGTIWLPSGHSIAPFKKVTSPIQMVVQQFGGKLSTRENALGESQTNYKEPNFYNNSQALGSFALGKLSPTGRALHTLATGQRYDDRLGESVNVDLGQDYSSLLMEQYAPLSVQQALEQDGDTSAIIASFFGLDLKPPGKKPKPSSKPRPAWRERKPISDSDGT